MTVPDIDTSKMSSDDIAKLQGKLDSDLKEAQKREARKKEEDFKTKVKKQHQAINDLIYVQVTPENIEHIKSQIPKDYPTPPESIGVGDIVCDNHKLSDLIDADKLTIFQYDFLVDECDPTLMSPTAQEKLQRMWSELRFLHEYYDKT